MSSDKTLGEIAEIIMGQSPAGDTCNDAGEGIPLLNGPTEFGHKHPTPVQFTTDPKKVSLLNDLLFCVRGSTTGKMNWADRPYAIGRGLAAIRGKDGYPNSFVRSVIEVNLDTLLAQATGSTFPNVSRELISSLPISNVSQTLASEVAAIIEPIDTRITVLREINTTLEAIAQAFFKSWFVDFDPVREKSLGKFPEAMDESTAALFPDAFEETELGMVPRGWEVVTVGDVAEIVKGKSYSSKDLVEKYSTALVTLKSFERGGGFRMDGFKPYQGTYKPNQVVNAGDLIVAYTDVTQAAELIGKPALVVAVDEYDTLVASLDVGIVRPNTSSCGKQFLLGLFKTDAFQQHTFAHTSGTTVLHLSKDGVGSYSFALPQPELCNRFEQIALALAERRQTNTDEMRTLSSLRETLLPRLISGQLRIADAEAEFEKVTA